MRTYPVPRRRGSGCLCAVSVAPALAQSVVRGKVTDAKGQPVQDATILFEATDANRKTQTKTDKNGDFLQVGLASGGYSVTASKDKVGTQTLKLQVRQGPNNPLTFSLSTAAAGTGPADKEAAAAVQAQAGAAVEAMKAGRHDEAIAKFTEVVAQDTELRGLLLQHRRGPAGQAAVHRGGGRLQESDRAEARFGRSVYRPRQHLQRAEEVRSGGRSQRQRLEVCRRSRRWRPAPRRPTTRASSSSTPASSPKRRTQFEAATKADPTMGMAHYQLGMTSLNLGQIPEAVAALEAYLKVDPNGPKAGEVKAALPALQGMLKK